MKFQILNTEGYLIERIPEVLKGVLDLKFEGASDGSIAVINNGDRVFYRDIIDGACSIPEGYLVPGEIKISIKPNIVLDRLYLIHDGVTVVYPDERERDEILNRLRRDLSRTTIAVEKMRRRISDIYDGHEVL